jgi:hypothetical protein
VNEPTERQTGETCVTVKTIRAPLGSQNVSVVRRCAAGPFAAIHGRELRSCVMDASRPLSREPDVEPEDDEPEDDDPELAPPDPPAAGDDAADPPLEDEAPPAKDVTASVTDPVDGTPLSDGAEGTVGAGEDTDGGSGVVGTGSEGTDRVGAGSVTGGGGGMTSATAAPAPAPAARSATAIAIVLVLPQLTSTTWITPFRPFRVRAKWVCGCGEGGLLRGARGRA